MTKVWVLAVLFLLVTQVELKRYRKTQVRHITRTKSSKNAPEQDTTWYGGHKPKKTVDLIVQLKSPKGKIQGHILKSIKGNDFYAFQEIPYAAPPTNQSRFQEPKPHEGWPGVLNTTANTKICIQEHDNIRLYDNENVTETEDCLYLNVYTPVKPGGKESLPVFVWIHGGAFMVGDGTFKSYNPSYFIDYGVVIVTLNYRLGSLGFLTTDDENLPGNLGLKDQQMAIKWTVNNIELFGGNPNKITIGGESAGGSAVSYQLLTKLNRGLFVGAIEQSGTALSMTTWQPKFRHLAFRLGQSIDNKLNSTDSKDLREVLLKASVDEIRTYQGLVETGITNGIMTDLSWAPIIENEINTNAIITKPMLEDFMIGNFNQVPYIIGFNSEESLAFTGQAGGDLSGRAKEYDEDPSLLINIKINAKNRHEAGSELKNIYTNLTFVEDLGAFYRYTSDATFVRPSLKQAEQSSKFVSVYVYQFSYSPTRSPIPGTENTAHGDELVYLWGWTGANVTVKETIRTQLLTLWTDFIKHQNPTPIVNDTIPIKWPRFEYDNTFYLNINETVEIKTNPRHYNEIRDILDKYIIEPYNIY